MAPFYTPKTTFGENVQLKPKDSVSAYFLTTYKAIITKLDQNIKQIELYTNCKIRGQNGRDLGHVTYFLPRCIYAGGLSDRKSVCLSVCLSVTA